MMTQILAGGGFLAALLVAIIFLMKQSRGRGKAEGMAEAKIEAADQHNKAVNAQNEITAQQNAEKVRQVEEVHEIHDKLNSDPAYAQRVRDRFTRD